MGGGGLPVLLRLVEKLTRGSQRFLKEKKPATYGVPPSKKKATRSDEKRNQGSAGDQHHVSEP